ncbi:nucleotidyltransferase [Comamonas serinivorans]|uniref:Nucleotidyltransferase n=2 Tax=Comamonas serinivorans TaxID=1082851 RepID=A0A1Y0EIT9_9BURK|nr:nucleotidyltransferase [Comamonas serinivorans]
MVLAAGRGERMRPLTDHTPKPLLTVRGQPLLQGTLAAMARAGVPQALVNTGWLGEQIGAHFGAPLPPRGMPEALQAHTPRETTSGLPALVFSHEALDFGHALETAGGIARALPWLQAQDARGIFWLAAGDVFAPQFAFEAAAVQRFAASDDLAHLWLVPNPAHNPRGDFVLAPDGRVLADEAPGAAGLPRHTYSTLGLFRCALFLAPWCAIAPGNPQGESAPLAPLLRRAIAAGRVSAELFTGDWTDVGTPERLAALQ